MSAECSNRAAKIDAKLATRQAVVPTKDAEAGIDLALSACLLACLPACLLPSTGRSQTTQNVQTQDLVALYGFENCVFIPGASRTGYHYRFII